MPARSALAVPPALPELWGPPVRPGLKGSVLADFVFGNGVTFPKDTFTQMAVKNVPAGNYVFIATISGIGSDEFLISGDPFATDTFCKLQDNLGGIIATAHSKGVTVDVYGTKHTITMTGGAAVPAGQLRTVTAWCEIGGSSGSFDTAQILTLKVGGFGF